jgi:hypothetical protein
VADADGRDGIVGFINVPFDAYLVRVTTAPAGYDRPDPKPVSVTEAEPNGGVSFHLSPAGSPPTEEPTEEPTDEPKEETAGKLVAVAVAVTRPRIRN